MIVHEANDRYRLVECFGTHSQLRYEIQEKYSYYENGNKVESWHMVCWSSDRLKAKEMFMRYMKYEQEGKHKKFKTSFEDIQHLWS